MMKQLKLYNFCFYIFIMMASQASWGQCGLSIIANNLSFTWDLNWNSQTISVLVTKSNPAACTFGLAFTRGAASNYNRAAVNGANNLYYQIFKDGVITRVLKDVPDIATSNDVIMVTMPASSGPQTVLYYFDIPYSTAVVPTILPPGVYTDSFEIRAYEGIDPLTFMAPPAASAPINLSVTVPWLIGVSLVDTGGVFQSNATTKSIDLGYLSTNQTSRFDLRIRTNAGYSVTVASANNGRLKMNGKNSYLPYTLYLNNLPADLSGATPSLIGSGQSGLAGLGFPARLVIGAVGATAIAGTYSDTIVITAATTD